MSRSLDIETFATAMAMISILQFGYIICEFGSNIIGPEYLASKVEGRQIEEVGTTILLGRLVVMVVYLSLVFLFFAPAKYNLTSFVIISTSLFLYTIQPIWLYTAQERFASLTLHTLSGKIVYLMLIFSALYIYPSMESALVGAVFGNLTTLGLMLIFGGSGKIFSCRHASLNLVFQYIKTGCVILLSRTFLNFHFYLGVPIIMQLVGDIQAASYAAAESVAKALRGGMGSASQAAFPHFLRRRDIRGFVAFILLVFVSSIVLGLILYVLSPLIHQLLFKQKFENFEIIAKSFSVLVPISILNQLLGYPAFSMLDKRYIVELTSVILPVLTFFSLFIFHIFSGEVSVDVWLKSILLAEFAMLATRVVIFKMVIGQISRASI